MGLRGDAAIVGFHELPATRQPTGSPEFILEQWARLAAAFPHGMTITAPFTKRAKTAFTPSSSRS